MTMIEKLTPHFIELTQDACLKVFWRKQALRLFLRQHKIAENQLATWTEAESKRDYLARLFYLLTNMPNKKGDIVILNMARSLAEMNHFPDLENWEDSSSKIANAHKAKARLKVEVDKINQQDRNEKEATEWRQRAAEIKQQQAQSRLTLEKISGKLTALSPLQGTQDGGYQFEKWFFELVDYAEIPARPPYKDPNGRQIDGSITIDGTTFLIEAKFTADQVTCTDIDSFFSKIATKADNTMGIMVSMSGFDPGAKKTASRDRTSILLMDFSHIVNLILPDVMTLQEVVQRIARHAAQTGESFLDASRFSG